MLEPFGPHQFRDLRFVFSRRTIYPMGYALCRRPLPMSVCSPEIQGRPVPCRAQIWWIRAVPNISVPCPHDPVPCQISKTPAARQRRLPCGPLYCSMKVTLWNFNGTFYLFFFSKAVPSAFGSSMVAGTYSANRSIRNQHQKTFLDRRKLTQFFSETI